MELPEEPEGFSPEDSLDEEAMLDRTPLRFGKFRGKTPEYVSQLTPRESSWLIWAYENVFNFDVCSAALYRELGGKGKRAVDTRSKNKSASPQDERDVYAQPNKPKSAQGYFDDMDDDIPF